MSDSKNRVTRRQALLAGAGAGLAPLVASTLASPASAASPMLGAEHPTHYRFKLGGFEITTIWDGAIQLKGPHPIFGQNVPEAEVHALVAENFLPPANFEIAFAPVVVNTGPELVLFDTGNGAGRRPKAGRTAATLAKAGYSPEQIDVVVLTHFHPDHIGGMMEGGKPAYPNARYITGETEYNFWSPKEMAEGKLARVGKLVQSNVVPFAEKMSFLKPDGAIAPGITAINAFGHTPGHMAYHIESQGRRLLLWADTTNHYVASLQRPDWHVRFDMDKAAAAQTRKTLLGMAAADRIPCAGYHMPFPSVGYVENRGAAYHWVPVSYQLNL